MGKVSVPAEKIGDDARSIIARYKAALGLADVRLVSGAACQARIRKRFAKGG